DISGGNLNSEYGLRLSTTESETQSTYETGADWAFGITDAAPWAWDNTLLRPVLYWEVMPSLAGAVTITGATTYGETLTANTGGITSPAPLGTVTYQWKRNGSYISGANGNTYSLTAADIGATISVEVWASNYLSSITSGATAAVAKKQLTISAPTLTKTKVYDGNTTAAVTAGTLSGIVGADAVTVSATASYDNKNAETGKTITVIYTLAGSAMANYIVPNNNVVNDGEITAKQLTISAPTLTKTKVYDGNTVAAVTAGTLSGIVGTENVTVSAAASYDNKNAETGKTITVLYTLAGADIANYTAPDNDVVNDGEITAKQLTISAPSLTKTKIYDGNTVAAVTAGALSGIVGTEDVSVSAAANYDNKNVGTGKTITVIYTLAGADMANYIVPNNDVVNDGEITAKQLTISAPNLTKTKVYDGNTTAAVTAGTLSGIVGTEDVSVSAAANYDNKNAETGKAITVVYTLAGADMANYTVPENYVASDGEITAKQLTISAPNLTKTKVYDGNTTAAVTAGALSGIVGTEDVSVSAAANYDNKNVGTGKTITVGYTLAGADLANYIVPNNDVVNDGEITAKQLTISAPTLTKTKVYDGNTTAAVTAGALSGIVGTEDVTVSAAANYDNKNAGTGKAITVVYTLAGADIANYIVPENYVANDGEITAKQLTISAPNLTKTKVYDGNTVAAVTAGALSGIVGTEDVSVSAAANYDNKNAGTGKTITVVYTLAGADLANYIVPENYVTSDGEITAKQLTISAPNLTKIKVYDGNTTAAVTTGALSGIVGTENVTVSAAANYDNKNVGTGKTITVVYTLAGTDLANYIVPENYVASDGEITAKEITVTANIATKVYGENDPAVFDYTYAPDLIAGEEFTGALSRVAGENAGTYNITQGTLDAGGNYTIILIGENRFSITQRPLAIAAIDETIDLGETPVLAYNITSGNLVYGDVLSGALTAIYNVVGTHTITQGALTAGSNYQITFTQGTLTVLSINVDITDISVDGEFAATADNNFHIIAECGSEQVVVSVTADQYATVSIGGVQQNSCAVNLLTYGDNIITVTVTAQNGNSATYTLTLHKPFPFEQLVKMRWNNTLTVINNPENNGGFSFTSYKWFRNGQLIGTDQSWSAGANGQQINPSDVFHVEVTAVGIDGVIRSCESSVMLRSMNVTAYPNPVAAGGMLCIEADVDEDVLRGAVIDVYSLTGSRVAQLNVQGRLTSIPINYATGMYLFVLNGKDGLRKDLRILVQ
ncbi:MAG: YDG domain-containing protein, partial [Bacteroidales bacterium]|nr:YDG domain-containing protein [Bacteroidales bacterium]